MDYKYGNYPSAQIHDLKIQMRKRIFFLLLCADEKLADKYEGVDVVSAIDSLLVEFGGLNELLMCPAELVLVMGMLTAAKAEYQKDDYSFQKYRKLILGAGAEVLKIKEV
jgi:hypothetical protein